MIVVVVVVVVEGVVVEVVEAHNVTTTTTVAFNKYPNRRGVSFPIFATRNLPITLNEKPRNLPIKLMRNPGLVELSLYPKLDPYPPRTDPAHY